MTTRAKTRFFTLLAGLFLALQAFALDPVYTGVFSNKALDGFDAVAYFSAGKPVEGNKQHQMEYQGATWLFSSAENLEAFRANPTKYAPQYGGYCAWAVAQGKDAPGDPQFWKIVDGKLYLNYSEKVQADWEADVTGFIQAAEKSWPKLLIE